MQAEFWLKRWQDGETGWQQENTNSNLIRHWGELAPVPSGAVLVPLCGKSLDMLWLASRGHAVVGVELSAVAAESFFHDNNMDAKWSTHEGMPVMESGPFRIFCGDFFDINSQMLGPIDYIYDRAALIALPDSLRTRYAQQLGALVSPSARGLLLTIEYDSSRRDGPPFSISQIETESLLLSHFEINLLGENDIIDEKPKYRAWGLDSLIERRYELVARGNNH